MIRKHTISKVWQDKEILFKDPETGEIHLKPGVHRKNYNDWINPDELETHINITELRVRKTTENMIKLDLLQINEEDNE